MPRFPYPVTNPPGSHHSAGPGMNAIDFGTPKGTPGCAPRHRKQWICTRSEDTGEESYGQWIELRAVTYPRTRVRFAHLSKRFVKRGQKVRGGDVICNTGNSGGSTGPHLHFEVSKRANIYKIAETIWIED